MLPFLLAALGLWILQTFLPGLIRYGNADLSMTEKARLGVGPRDRQPDLGPYGERAQRALINYAEAMPVFLTLALLLHTEGDPQPLATTAAGAFLVCRVFYVPAYLSGIPGLRSTLWTLGLVCLLAMGYALVA